MDLGIHQQDLTLAEGIHGDKASGQKVSTDLCSWVSWYQQQNCQGHV